MPQMVQGWAHEEGNPVLYPTPLPRGMRQRKHRGETRGSPDLGGGSGTGRLARAFDSLSREKGRKEAKTRFLKSLLCATPFMDRPAQGAPEEISNRGWRSSRGRFGASGQSC